MKAVEELDLLFQSVLARFFSIRTRQPASGAVTFAQMRVLWTLEIHGSVGVGEMARMIGITNSTATELVDRLVRGGYVRRVQSAEDRRQVVLTLLPRGKRMLDDFARRRQERFRTLLKAVPPADVRRMAESLRTLNAILERWRPNGQP
jgi:DNA-binding MarR family transcriptional regulator